MTTFSFVFKFTDDIMSYIAGTTALGAFLAKLNLSDSDLKSINTVVTLASNGSMVSVTRGTRSLVAKL